MNESTRLRHDSVPTGNMCQGRTPLEKTLLVLLFTVVAVGIALSIALVAYYRGPIVEYRIRSKECITRECITTAARFLKYMDLSVDPCQDFYSFSCGGWIQNSHLFGPMTSRFSELNSNIKIRLKEILEDPETNSIPVHRQKAKRFFQACMDTKKRELARGTPLLTDLEELGGWPLLAENWNGTEFNWTNTLVKLFEMGFDKDILLKINIQMDIKNVSQTIITVDQPTLGMPDRLYYLIDHPFDFGFVSYKLFILRIALYLQPKLSAKQILSDLEDAMAIEKQLAKASLSKSERKDITKLYNVMTIGELENFAPEIPWRYWINSVLPDNVIVQDDERIMVPVPSAVEALQDILTQLDNHEKGKAALANYLMYRTAAVATESLSHTYRLAFYDFRNGLLNRLYSYPDPWQACVEITDHFFYFSLESSYAKQYMDNATAENLQVMFQDIRDSSKEEIERADWLDSETRNRALEKGQLIRSAIGYQEEIINDTILDDFFQVDVDQDHYSNVKEINGFFRRKDMTDLHKLHKRFRWYESTDLLVANAYYSSTQNSITLPVGFLQEGTYDPARPNYINYGSLGMVVAHELTHAFDSSGSKFDGNGNWKMWWANETWAKFNERNKCFIQQYDNFYDNTLNATVNGTRTLGENIADNGGLRTAYMAYNKWVSRNGQEKTLPGIPYSAKQMFWVAFASVWCRKQTEGSRRATMNYDVHSPASFRVTGALANLKEFSEDFQCKEGTPLNPKKKCSLWN